MASTKINFDDHVKMIIREKAPKTGARLIQTTSKDFDFIKNLVHSKLTELNIDLSRKNANGDVRIVFELGPNTNIKKEYIHTYGIEINELYKIVISSIYRNNPRLIHGKYADSEMNFWPSNVVKDILAHVK
jgi:hypothetical protein